MSIAAGVDSWANRNILGTRLLVFIGLISYPLYLWHQPLLFISGVIDYRASGKSVSALVVLLSVFISFITYMYVEKPLRTTIRTARVVFLLVLAVALCAGLGYMTFTQRISGHLRQSGVNETLMPRH